MEPIDMNKIYEYINASILELNQQSLKSIEKLDLETLLPENPYLLAGTKNPLVVGELITDLLDAFLSSSEEKSFGNFLEDLAIFVAEMTCGGHKSTAPGVDLEFLNNEVYYIVSIKSGPSWGNSSQQGKQEQDLKNAVIRVKQSKRGVNVQPVLGICYGKTKTRYLRGYMKVVGQNFWYLVSENLALYTDIIEPVGFKAKEHNKFFADEKSKAINRFTKQFMDRYCDTSGSITWDKLVEFNSGNFDLDKFLPS